MYMMLLHIAPAKKKTVIGVTSVYADSPYTKSKPVNILKPANHNMITVQDMSPRLSSPSGYT